jgi:2-desacetyl-2-hydroxyethyl bacteriochlorophyllide A dehydrogenase
MLAVVVEQPNEVQVREIPTPHAGRGEVVIQVGACGICGTDVHVIEGEYPPTVFPIVIGHEFGGTVVEVGPGVTSVKVGDRVGVDPALPCGGCYFCQKGMGNLCEAWLGAGVAGTNGGFAEYAVLPTRILHPLPAGMSDAAAGLIEPVACVVRGFHRLAPLVGETYLIFGAGPMGLLQAQVARFNGASEVAIIDINESRLDLAKNGLGFTTVATSLDQLRDRFPRGFDNVIEATGVPAVAEVAIEGVKRRGKLLQFGVCPPGSKVAYDPYKIYSEEITIMGSISLLNSYGPAIDIIQAGAIDVPKMVSHTFPLERFEEALAVASSGQGMKVQVGGRA